MKTEIRKFNLTLIELVISLGILAAIASVTLSLLEESTEKNSLELTYNKGCRIQEVINAQKTDDGISRFVSDMGRLPVVINTDEGKRLAELFAIDEIAENTKWAASVSFSNSDDPPAGDSGLDFPDAFKDLTLACGWSGPYLYNRSDELLDGWNNEWELLASDGSRIEAPAINNFIYGVESLGSDSGVDEESWSERNQKFKFTTSDIAAPTNAELIVTIAIRDNSASNSVMRAAAELEDLTSVADWSANTEYKINDKIKNGDFLFCCKSVAITNKGKSGVVQPIWDTVIDGVTQDKNIIWVYAGPADDEPNWQANCIYSKNDSVQSEGHAFTCLQVRPVSGSTTPTFNKNYGDITNSSDDSDITWQCIYPEPCHMTHLRVAFFMPRVTSTECGIRRFIAIRTIDSTATDHDDSTEFTPADFFDSMPTVTANWIAYNQVELKNLIPGARKLYVYGYYNNGGDTCNKCGSDVIDLKLKPGINRITAFLTNSL